MLMQIRERATGIFAYIIVILIVIPFAFWGIQEYFGGPADQKVAEVNGEEIVKRVFDAQVQDQRRYLKSILGSSFDALYSDENKLKQTVLDDIILNTLLTGETKNAGYRISNNVLTARIQSVPQFQTAGRFDVKKYEQLLASQRRSPVEFENQLRQEESINQFQGSAVYTSFLPNQGKQRYAALKQQKRNFDYFLIKPNVETIDVTESDIKNYYKANKASFKTPERVKLEYLELKQKDIADRLSFTEEEIQSYYDDDPERYQTPELRKASHILLKLDEDASDDQVTAALDKLQAAADRINKGETFASVAKELSEDKFSAKNGGNLGFLSRTDIDNPVFVQKVFSMDKGDMSSPIRTSLGVQLIKLEDITAPKTKSFEQVKSQIENELRAEAATKEFVELQEKLSNLSYVNEDNLEAAADELNMKVQTSDWIQGATLEGIASYPAVVNAAFSEEVLGKGANSELLEVGDGHSIVVRVAEHEPSNAQPLKEVMDKVKAAVRTVKAREQLIAKGSEIIKALNNKSLTMQDSAHQKNSKLNKAGALLRDDESIPREVVDHVFAMATTDKLPVFDGLELNDGVFAVIRLNEVVVVAEKDAVVETADWISVQGKYGRREMQAMLKALRETGDVVIFSGNL